MRFLAVIVLVAALGCGERSEWYPEAIVGIDADTALVVLEAYDRPEETRHQRLARIDARGTPRWTRDLGGLIQPLQPHMTVADDIVTVRLQDRDHARHWVEAFHLADGRTAWTADLGTDEPGLYVASLAAPGVDVEVDVGGHVVVLDRATGARRTSATVDVDELGNPRSPEVIGDRLVLTGYVDRVAIALGTGAVASMGAGRGSGCVVDGTYVVILGDDVKGYRVAGLDLATAKPRWEQPIELGRRYTGGLVPARCGLRGRRIVFTTDVDAGVIGFDLDQRRLAFELRLGPDHTRIVDHHVLRDPAAATLSGALTRFAYVQLGDRSEGVPEIVTVDLDAGTVVHRAADPELLYAKVLHAGHHHVIQLHSTFTVIDGDSGAVVASRTLETIILEVRSDQLAGGRLWLTAARTGLALDLATLQPVGKTTIAITDDSVMRRRLQP